MLKTCDWISLSDLVLEGSSLPKWLPLSCSNGHYVSYPGLEWEQSLMEVKVSPFHVPKVGELFLLFLSPPPLFLFLYLPYLPVSPLPFRFCVASLHSTRGSRFKVQHHRYQCCGPEEWWKGHYRALGHLQPRRPFHSPHFLGQRQDAKNGKDWSSCLYRDW